mgnify:CR=1 FL=1
MWRTYSSDWTTEGLDDEALPAHRTEERTPELYDVLKEARLDGMQSFDDHLAELYAAGVIDYETGYSAATSSQAFKMAATQVEVMRSTQDDSARQTRVDDVRHTHVGVG